MTAIAILLILVAFLLIGIGIVMAIINAAKKPYTGPEDKVSHFQDQAQPGQGIIKNTITRAKTRSDFRTQEVVNTATQTATQGTRLETEALRAQHEKERVTKEVALTIAKDNLALTKLLAEQSIVDLATQVGMDVPTYFKWILHQQMSKIDLENRKAEYDQDFEMISRVQQEALELIDRATVRLFNYYDQRAELEAKDDPAKDEKIRHINFLIEAAEKEIHGQQTRYLEVTLGEKEVRSLPAFDSQGRDELEDTEDPEPKRRGGWPKGKPRGRKHPAPNQ